MGLSSRLEQMNHLLDTLVEFEMFVYILSQKLIDPIDVVDREVDLFAVSPLVSAYVDQVLGFPVCDHDLLDPISSLHVLRGDDFAHDSADASEWINGWIMTQSCQSSGKDDMTVQYGPDGIGNGFIEIISFHEDRVEPGYASSHSHSCSLQQPWEEGERGWRVAPCRGRFTDRQTDFPLGGGHAGDGVHEQHHVLPLVAEVFGDGRRDVRPLDPNEGGLVGCRNNDDRPGQSFRAKVSLQKLSDLPAAFTDERNDADICIRVFGKHTQENALSDTAAGEDPDPLSFPTREQRVDCPDAGSKGFLNAASGHGIGWGAGSRAFLTAPDRSLLIDRFSQAVDDSPEELVTDANGEGFIHGRYAASWGDALHFSEGHHQHPILFESDDLGKDGCPAFRTVNAAGLSDGYWRPVRFNDESDDLADFAPYADGFGSLNCSNHPIRVHPLRLPSGSHRSGLS